MAEFSVKTTLPDGWFVYGMGECVKPQIYRGDRHDNNGDGYWCELQHRTGGRLTRIGRAESPQAALEAAIQKATERADG